MNQSKSDKDALAFFKKNETHIQNIYYFIFAILVILGAISIFTLVSKIDKSNNTELALIENENSNYFTETQEDEINKNTEEYYKLIKGTLVEQLQNIFIPSYDDENILVKLEKGEVLIKEPPSNDFPEGNSLWTARLNTNKNSFIIDDFNKDNLNDVAHIIGYTGFGSGYFYKLSIFINENGQLKYLTQKEIGDRIIINNIKYDYDSKLFIVDIITQGEGENFMGYCCPNTPKIFKFKLKNNKLIEV